MSGWRQKPPPVALVWAERQCPVDLGGPFCITNKTPTHVRSGRSTTRSTVGVARRSPITNARRTFASPAFFLQDWFSRLLLHAQRITKTSRPDRTMDTISSKRSLHLA